MPEEEDEGEEEEEEKKNEKEKNQILQKNVLHHAIRNTMETCTDYRTVLGILNLCEIQEMRRF